MYTKNQKELINLVKNKQQELNKKLYFIYRNSMRKMFLIDVISTEGNILNYQPIEEVNTKVCYSLLDKNILSPEYVGNFKLVTLSK